MELDDVIAHSKTLSPWAHLATVRPDGSPDVVPVHPAWHDGALWVMVDAGSLKARNVATEPRVALHWQVTEAGDGLELWGVATVVTDLDTKRAMWTGVFDYDLSAFSPDGPDGEGSAFIRVEPRKALFLKAYGIGGIERWKAD